jgi:hypothetical protein
LTTAQGLLERCGMSLPVSATDDCPQPPGLKAGLSTLILHEACHTAGGIVHLARLLCVPVAFLERWLDGESEAPRDIYQACIDIVLLHEPEGEALSARRGAGSPRSPAR